MIAPRDLSLQQRYDVLWAAFFFLIRKTTSTDEEAIVVMSRMTAEAHVLLENNAFGKRKHEVTA